MEIKLHTPLTEDKILNLKAGDSVLLSGVIILLEMLHIKD
jgi:fumarate hydratase subunit beta